MRISEFGRMVIVTAAGMAALAACSDSNEPDPPGLAVARATPSGDGQSGPAGQPLPSPIRVRVTRDGQPEAGVTVTWATSGPGSAVTPASNTTDAEGIAAATWTLTQTQGATSASATVSGASGSPVGFSATATSGGGTSGVTVGNNFFNPATRNITAGTRVVWTWVNTGQISHSVESTGTPGFPNSAVLTGSGQSYAHTFDTPGTYTYICGVHGAAMAGTIVVQ